MDRAYMKALEKEIAELPPTHRIAFAASCCERMIPNYSAFSRAEGWGDPAMLRTALDEVWEILQGKLVDTERIHQLQQYCEGAVPDFDYLNNGVYAYEALQSAKSISHCLELCLNPTSHIVNKIAERVVNIVTEYIRILKEDADSSWLNKTYAEQNEDIDNHPFTIREIAKQREDLQRLKEIKTLDREFLEWLRTSFDNGGRSLIDVS
jgi:uncharacterized protein YjaG (DUF416 family)